MLGFDLLLLAAAGICAAVLIQHLRRRAAGADARALVFYRETARDSAAQGAEPQAVSLPTDEEAEILAAAAKVRRMDLQKRVLDIALSLSLLVFLAPLLAITALAVRLESPGPILYRQRRVGLNGRVFDVIKFRSMVRNAEANGPQYAATNDARVTRIGRFIRKFRIDEIPQAFNVLKGEMSFVGPRPERPEFVQTLEQEIPLYQCRHTVKPGITGWAQVKYEYAASVEGARQKLVYDLDYIRNYSLLLDLMIVVMTVRVALFGLGSR